MLVVQFGDQKIANANSYISVRYLRKYLADRNRLSENDFDTAEEGALKAAVIAATQYIDERFTFRGVRKHRFDGNPARAEITLTQNAVDGDTVTLDGKQYTVTVGANATETVRSIIEVINGDETVLVVASPNNAVISLEAVFNGTSGNGLELSTDIAGAVVTEFEGGVDEGSQSREFPRDDLYDEAGSPIVGVPAGLQEATAEYSIRALAVVLAPDPQYEVTGQTVKRRTEIIGPIEDTVEYVSGATVGATVQLIRDYPQADILLRQYTRFSGVIRG